MTTNELITILEWLELECKVMAAALHLTGEDVAETAYNQLDYADCLEVYQQIYNPTEYIPGVPETKIGWYNGLPLRDYHHNTFSLRIWFMVLGKIHTGETICAQGKQFSAMILSVMRDVGESE